MQRRPNWHGRHPLPPGRAAHRAPGGGRWILKKRGPYLGTVTKVTVLTRLLASTKLPSFVTSVLRTMLPPPGIVQLWNFSILGSKRTTVFGFASDSLYQMTSLIAEIP